MTVTSHDVARLAGVSQPTVSRALRGDTRVAEATRRRVREAAAQLGYVASELGRNLSTRSTRQVAMVADLRNPLYPQLVVPLHDRFAEHGYRMVLFAERGDNRRSYEQLLNRSVDGAVLTTTLIGSSLSAALRERRTPFLELNRLSGHPGVHGVAADNAAGAAAITRLVVEHGHRRIGVVLGDSETSTSRDREAGVRTTLADAGLALPPTRVARFGFGYEDGEHGMDKVMSGRTPPTAVICASDSLAVGALNAARRRGLRVPDDVSVVGFDDLAIASWPAFDLTTVRVDFAAMAVAAVDDLVEQMRDGPRDDGRIQIFPTTVVPRATHVAVRNP